VAVAVGVWVVEAVVHDGGDNGLGDDWGLDNGLGNSGDNGLGDGVDGWDGVAGVAGVGGVAVAVVVVEDGGVSLRVSLTLDQVAVAVGVWVVEAVGHNRGDNRLGDNGGLDDGLGNSGDDSLGNGWDIVVHTVVGNVVDTSGVGGIGGVQQQLGVSLGLGLSLTLDEVGVGVAQGVHQARVLNDGLVSSHGLDKGDNGLVQVGGGLGVQVVDLGGLDGQGVVRDNSSVGVVHHAHGLGVGIAEVYLGLGKKKLGVSLGGGLGGSSHSDSDESLHG